MKKKLHINEKVPLFCFDSLDSTMNEIKKKKYNVYEKAVVLANQQSNGRGRRNNNWISEKGNLYLSVRLREKIKKNHHFATYMVGIVLYDIINKYITKPLKIFIKWPNDIYVDNKKISGILIEFLSYGKSIKDIIIGIGLNINNTPKELSKQTTCLKNYCNESIDSMELIKLILQGIDSWVNILNYNKNNSKLKKLFFLLLKNIFIDPSSAIPL